MLSASVHIVEALHDVQLEKSALDMWYSVELLLESNSSGHGGRMQLNCGPPESTQQPKIQE